MSYFFLFLLSLSFLIVNYPLFILAIVTCTPHLLVGGRGEHVELEVLREEQEPGAGCLEQCLSDHLCFVLLPKIMLHNQYIVSLRNWQNMVKFRIGSIEVLQ